MHGGNGKQKGNHETKPVPLSHTFVPISIIQTIKECTVDMDSDTWNAYHIISNRARAVCYSVRQQLFRLRAEHTVNSLISTATSQLDAMMDLKVDFIFMFMDSRVLHKQGKEREGDCALCGTVVMVWCCRSSLLFHAERSVRT